MYKRIFLLIGLLVGSIIGAGVFALPFVFSQSGFLTGLAYLSVSVLIYILLYLLYADIVVRTEGEHRFVGYTRIYFGKVASWFSVLVAILGAMVSLTAYLVLSISFMSLVFPSLSHSVSLLAFWAIGSFAIFLKLKRIVAFEFFVTIAMLGIVFLIFVLGADTFFENLSVGEFVFNFKAGALPFAPIFYALGGMVAIPSIVQYFRVTHGSHNYSAMRTVIIWGVISVAVVYTLFVIGVIGLSDVISTDSVGGLLSSVPAYVLVSLGTLGLFSLITSYIAIGLDTAKSLKYDLNIHHTLRALIVVLAPLGIYTAGFTDFFKLISFTGGIFSVLVSMMIMGMWLRVATLAKEPTKIIKHTHTWFIAGAFVILLATLINEVFQLIF